MSDIRRVKGILEKIDTSAFNSQEEWAEDWLRNNTDKDIDHFKKNKYTCLEVVLWICDDKFISLKNELYKVVSKEVFGCYGMSEVEEKDGLLHFHVMYHDGGFSLEEAIEIGMKGE